MTYASTMAHAGTFRLVLTMPGHDPAVRRTAAPPRCWCSPGAPPLCCSACEGGDLGTGKGQLTKTWTPASVTGAYLAVKKPLAKHSEEPELFANCWLVKVMLLSALSALPVSPAAW